MAASNRSALLTKIHKVLKKEYKPGVPDAKRPLLEQLLFASLLEESPLEAANQAFLTLQTEYFDWNEVRVSTVTELAEPMRTLPNPAPGAGRMKRVLQSVFESQYSFDLEPLKKQNIGAAVKKLEKFDGVTPFAIAFATQTALGGHAIPVGAGALDVLLVLGAISPKEREAGTAPGLERAIPKNKGIEFGMLLHQLGVEYARSPHSPATRKVILSIDPEAKDRLPKRQSKREQVEEQGAKVKKKADAGAPRKKVAKSAPPAKKVDKKAVKKKKVQAASTTKTKAASKKKPR